MYIYIYICMFKKPLYETKKTCRSWPSLTFFLRGTTTESTKARMREQYSASVSSNSFFLKIEQERFFFDRKREKLFVSNSPPYPLFFKSPLLTEPTKARMRKQNSASVSRNSFFIFERKRERLDFRGK